MKYLIPLLLLLSSAASADNFETETQTVIRHKGVQISMTLAENDNIVGNMQAILQRTQEAGTPEAELKRYLNMRVPEGKQVQVMVVIAVQKIEDAE